MSDSKSDTLDFTRERKSADFNEMKIMTQDFVPHIGSVGGKLTVINIFYKVYCDLFSGRKSKAVEAGRYIRQNPKRI